MSNVTSVRVPAMGESITEGIIARWLKAPGDRVAADEPLVEVETDKITIEVPSPAPGVLARRTAEEGAKVQVGEVIAEITAAGPGEGVVAKAPPAATESRVPASPAVASEPVKSPSAPPAPHGPTAAPVAMPAARAEAGRRGVDLSTVQGTGRGDRVLKEDVLRVAAASSSVSAAPAAASGSLAAAAPREVRGPSVGAEERKPMTTLRKRVAARLLEAQQQAAILTTFNEVDMSAVVELRKRYKDLFVEKHGVKLGFMSFFVRATVEALRAFPGLNAEIDGDDVVYKYHYDVGVAVGGGKGLVVPVLRNADRLGLAAIEREIGELATKARTNKLSLEDLTGGTFTISNGGVYGSMLSTPILNPPQTGILGLHNIVDRPMAVAGKVEIRPVMYLALSYDHRLVDGREAVQFLVAIKAAVEAPERLLLEL